MVKFYRYVPGILEDPVFDIGVRDWFANEVTPSDTKHDIGLGEHLKQPETDCFVSKTRIQKRLRKYSTICDIVLDNGRFGGVYRLQLQKSRIRLSEK
jgi:hypothetical protein